MQKVILSINYLEYDLISDLDQKDRELVTEAEKVVSAAYAPYSKYYVGAALRLENGQIITGNNQENVAYPSGICAERVAIFYASSQYPDQKIESIAITAKAGDFVIKNPVAPCGACRQVLAEYQTKQKSPIKIILKGETGKIQVISSIDDILPFMFHAEELKK
ncbi:MAG: cytidine deaminase [Bacteroidetes bacterium]|nr:cytidine deaminase [Bacteroidota bacterium]